MDAAGGTAGLVHGGPGGGNVRLTGLDQEPVDLVYEPLLGLADGSKDLRASLSFVVANSLPTASSAPSLRNVVRRVDPNLPITQVRTVDSLVGDSWTAWRSPSRRCCWRR